MRGVKMSINDVVNNKGLAAKKKKHSKGDVLFMRMLSIFALLVVYTVFELYAHSNGADLLAAFGVVKVGSVIFGICAIVFLALCFIKKAQGAFGKGRVFSAGFISAVCAAACVFLSATYNVSDSSALIILAFVAAALVFVAYSFSRDFFLLSLVTVIGVVLAALPVLFVYSGVIRDVLAYGSVIASFIVCAGFCVLSAAACFGKNEKLSKWFFNCGYVRRYPLFLLPAVCFAGAIIRLLLPVAFSYALIFSIVLYMVFLVIYAFDSAK